MARKTALIYMRESFIRKGEQAISPERLFAACKDYCDRKGWGWEVFQDADEGMHYSGRFEMNRPGWLKLLKRLPDPDVHAIVVASIDRASRSLKGFFSFYDVCEKAGVSFVSTSQGIDTSTATGKAMLAMTVVFAAFEADVASDRVSATVAHKKAQGVRWGYTPFGCDRLPGGVLIPNADIETVRRGLELYANGGSYEGVAQALNGLGLRFLNRQDERIPLDTHHIRTLVCLVPVYAGYLINGRAKDLDPDAPFEKGAHEPMISDELLQSVLQSHRAKRSPTKRSARTYTLTPLLHCAQPLRGSNSNHQYTYKHTERCTAGNIRTYDAAGLEAKVVDLLGGLAIPADLIAEIRVEAMQRQASPQEAAQFDEQLRAVETKRQRLLELDNDLDKERYRRHKAALDVQTDQLEQMRGAGARELETVLDRLSTIGTVIAQGTPVQQ